MGAPDVRSLSAVHPLQFLTVCLQDTKSDSASTQGPPPSVDPAVKVSLDYSRFDNIGDSDSDDNLDAHDNLPPDLTEQNGGETFYYTEAEDVD